ncbi:cystatin like 1 [Phyllostomus discolor]|uniref:Cystatin like 1 n=1 Tax=Phyllostomus discolor TaxID=89673 RepID=A0A833Z062_9CHIR|nr:cystatin like 1 [Phyllostomus discolor]
MGVECWRNTLLLLAALVLAAKLGHFQRWGGFQEKSVSKKNMNSTLKFFIENYNNVSNDMYLFRIDKLLQSHMQSFICNFLMYTVPWMNYYQLWNNSCLEA